MSDIRYEVLTFNTGWVAYHYLTDRQARSWVRVDSPEAADAVASVLNGPPLPAEDAEVLAAVAALRGDAVDPQYLAGLQLAESAIRHYGYDAGRWLIELAIHETIAASGAEDRTFRLAGLKDALHAADGAVTPVVEK